jgi:hypothetical protein
MYEIELTNHELRTLDWLASRGYWSQEAYLHLHLADDEEEDVLPDVPRIWNIPEHAAWDILEICNEEGYLACCGGELLDKLLVLEQSIV